MTKSFDITIGGGGRGRQAANGVTSRRIEFKLVAPSGKVLASFGCDSTQPADDTGYGKLRRWATKKASDAFKVQGALIPAGCKLQMNDPSDKTKAPKARTPRKPRVDKPVKPVASDLLPDAV